MAAPEPQAAPAGSYTPILTDISRLARAPFAPQGAFEEQRDRPTFWLPWLVMSVLMAALAAYNLPVSKIAMRISLEARGQPVPPSIGPVGTVLSLITPGILVLIIVLIAAAVLYFTLMVIGAQARFKGMMTVTIFVVPIAFLQSVLSSLVIRMRGLDSIESMRDMQPAFGLNLLVSADFAHDHRLLNGFLSGCGPFEIWSLAITAIGLMALEKVPRGKAWTAAVVGFVVSLCLGAVLRSLGPA